MLSNKDGEVLTNWMLNLVVVPHKGGPKAANAGAARTSIYKDAFLGHFANYCDNE